MLSGDAQQFVCLVLCATIIIDKETPNGVIRELCTASRFYAIATERLLELIREAGFQECRRIDETIYQPILAGEKSRRGNR